MCCLCFFRFVSICQFIARSVWKMITNSIHMSWTSFMQDCCRQNCQPQWHGRTQPLDFLEDFQWVATVALVVLDAYQKFTRLWTGPMKCWKRMEKSSACRWPKETFTWNRALKGNAFSLAYPCIIMLILSYIFAAKFMLTLNQSLWWRHLDGDLRWCRWCKNQYTFLTNVT